MTKLGSDEVVLEQVPSASQKEKPSQTSANEPKYQQVEITQAQVFDVHVETMEVDEHDEQIVLTPQDQEILLKKWDGEAQK